MRYRHLQKGRAPMVWRNLGMTASFALFVLIFIVGPTFLVPTQEKDALTVMQLAQNAAFEAANGGYYYTALVSSYTPELVQRLIVFVLGAAFIYRLFRDLRSLPMAGLATVLVVSPIFLFLTLFVKDTSIPLLVLLVLAILRSRLPIVVRLSLSLAIYVGYGAIFREYYLVVALIFGLLVAALSTPYPWRFLYVLAGGGALFFVPPRIFRLLEGSRDIFNASRVGHELAGARTAFLNYLPPNNLPNFLVDYIYAALRLNFAPLFNFGIKELFLSFNVLAFLALAIVGMRATDERVRLPALLYISHFLVSILFEPDLSSYLRHSSSVLLYLAPAMVLLDRRMRARPTRTLQPVQNRMALEGMES